MVIMAKRAAVAGDGGGKEMLPDGARGVSPVRRVVGSKRECAPDVLDDVGPVRSAGERGPDRNESTSQRKEPTSSFTPPGVPMSEGNLPIGPSPELGVARGTLDDGLMDLARRTAATPGRLDEEEGPATALALAARGREGSYVCSGGNDECRGPEKDCSKGFGS